MWNGTLDCSWSLDRTTNAPPPSMNATVYINYLWFRVHACVEDYIILVQAGRRPGVMHQVVMRSASLKTRRTGQAQAGTEPWLLRVLQLSIHVLCFVCCVLCLNSIQSNAIQLKEWIRINAIQFNRYLIYPLNIGGRVIFVTRPVWLTTNAPLPLVPDVECANDAAFTICLWFRVRAGVEGDIILMQGLEGDTTIKRRLVTNQAVMRPTSSKIGHTSPARTGMEQWFLQVAKLSIHVSETCIVFCVYVYV
jgi:hypothetical protein